MALKPKIAGMLKPEDIEQVHARLSDQRETYGSIAEWMRARGLDVSEENVRTYAIWAGLRKSNPNYLSKIDKMLTPEHRKDFELFMGDLRNTLEDLIAWLKARGYPASKSVVHRYRGRFRTTMRGLNESALAAQAVLDLAGKKGAATITDGLLLRCEQVLFEQFMRLKEKGKLDTKRLLDLSRSGANVVKMRETVENVRREIEDRQRNAADLLEAAAKKGASGKAIVARMRDILGV